MNPSLALGALIQIRHVAALSIGFTPGMSEANPGIKTHDMKGTTP